MVDVKLQSTKILIFLFQNNFVVLFCCKAASRGMKTENRSHCWIDFIYFSCYYFLNLSKSVRIEIHAFDMILAVNLIISAQQAILLLEYMLSFLAHIQISFDPQHILSWNKFLSKKNNKTWVCEVALSTHCIGKRMEIKLECITVLALWANWEHPAANKEPKRPSEKGWDRDKYQIQTESFLIGAGLRLRPFEPAKPRQRWIAPRSRRSPVRSLGEMHVCIGDFISSQPF